MVAFSALKTHEIISQRNMRAWDEPCSNASLRFSCNAGIPYSIQLLFWSSSHDKRAWEREVTRPKHLCLTTHRVTWLWYRLLPQGHLESKAVVDGISCSISPRLLCYFKQINLRKKFKSSSQNQKSLLLLSNGFK